MQPGRGYKVLIAIGRWATIICMMTNPLEEHFAKRGAVAELARALGISHAAIRQWTRVPAERVVEVERITGIPREALRPDLYRRAPALPASQAA